MKIGRAVLVAAALVAAPLTVAAPAHAAATAYYLDCGAASAGSGTQSAPWNSLGSANAHTFAPGDSLLLKRGSTCTGQSLTPKGSGSASAPVTIDAYGTGNLPVLAGAGQVTDVVRLSDQQYWEIRDLDISNQGAASATRRGVHITRTDSGTGTHYVLENLTIHDVNGDQSKKDDDASAGIFFEVLGNTTRTNFDDVLVQNNTIRTVDRYGIHFWTRWMTRPQLANPNCGTTCGAWDPQTRVVVRSNTVTDIGGDAVDLHHTSGALAEYNRIDGFREREPQHCAAGLWGWNTDNAVYQFNEVSGGQSTCDGQGFDLDEAEIATVYQYNYSHDNQGGFMLLCNGSGSTTDRSVVRYNISQNDQGQLFDFVCAKDTNTSIYNNTFYLGKQVQVINNANGSTAADAVFQNNIFYVATTGASYVTPGGLAFDSNVFYGQHPAAEPADANKITADPLLAAPGTATSRTDIAGYKLKTGSPAAGTGQALVTADGRDYFGGTVRTGCRPDRGAHQLSTSCVPQSAPPLADGTYKITAGTLAVDDPASSTTAGTQLILYTQHSAANQQWQVQRNTDGTYALRSVASHLCADINQNSTAAGATVIQWTCSGDNNQRWTVTPSGSGFTLAARSSGLLLSAASLTDNAGLTQQPASAAGNHVWQFTAVS
ncbi:RICIN domain-containing protein [Streptomyces sp. NBC_01477]|uniref:RICIN domain-containing protein n=1 Tax=Streptomyces sp. NBC_01477 TaxID=2976015 RepID=UPI002E34528E|nr:RICIN domain-containing protein [Streptomyces sp. NBC_01477]